MFKLCIKFIFYPVLIVIVGMYYLVSYLTIAITAIVSGIAICKRGNKKSLVVTSDEI